MYRVCLINMPFASLERPSIALTQLKAVTDQRFGDEVLVEVCYINHDFAKFIGLSNYKADSPGMTSLDSHTTGIGDWLFRQAAFPELSDNSKRYFDRYYPYRDEAALDFKQLVARVRSGLDEFFDLVISKYRLDQAAVVGFTSMFSQNVSCFALARRIKNYNPEVIITMGGSNCEAPMGQEIVKNVPQIDFVFSGPALKSFPQFLQYQLAGEGNKRHSIAGKQRIMANGESSMTTS